MDEMNQSLLPVGSGTLEMLVRFGETIENNKSTVVRGCCAVSCTAAGMYLGSCIPTKNETQKKLAKTACGAAGLAVGVLLGEWTVNREN